MTASDVEYLQNENETSTMLFQRKDGAQTQLYRFIEMSVYLLSTLDTKGEETKFLADRLVELNVDLTLVDVGSYNEPTIAADVSREAIFAAAVADWRMLAKKGDRGEAVAAAARGAARFIAAEHEAGKVTGVIGLGGSAGTTIAASAMRQLPIGVPKLIVSTLASGQVRPFVGDKDIIMMNSVVDIAGLNSINRVVFQNAASAMAGMTSHQAKLKSKKRPVIAATMFGVTTPCVNKARKILEEAGYEVVVFHATGTGGQAMESLIREGQIVGVLDITTTELADEMVGGVLSAGSDRLTAATERGLPQVVSVGALDMVNFGPPETTPEKFQSRSFFQHNPTVTLMRTTAEECEQLGREIGGKISKSAGPTAVILPLEGVSAIDAADQPFCDPEARECLFHGIRNTAVGVEIIEYPGHINDGGFAERAARKLIEMLRESNSETE